MASMSCTQSSEVMRAFLFCVDQSLSKLAFAGQFFRLSSLSRTQEARPNPEVMRTFLVCVGQLLAEIAFQLTFIFLEFSTNLGQDLRLSSLSAISGGAPKF